MQLHHTRGDAISLLKLDWTRGVTGGDKTNKIYKLRPHLTSPLLSLPRTEIVLIGDKYWPVGRRRGRGEVWGGASVD